MRGVSGDKTPLKEKEQSYVIPGKSVSINDISPEIITSTPMQSAQLPLGVPVSPIVDDGDGPVHPPAKPYTIQTNSSGTTRGRGSAATVQKVQRLMTTRIAPPLQSSQDQQRLQGWASKETQRQSLISVESGQQNEHEYFLYV